VASVSVAVLASACAGPQASTYLYDAPATKACLKKRAEYVRDTSRPPRGRIGIFADDLPDESSEFGVFFEDTQSKPAHTFRAFLIFFRKELDARQVYTSSLRDWDWPFADANLFIQRRRNVTIDWIAGFATNQFMRVLTSCLRTRAQQ
jgi:hypothetical protein